jgi:hypothetical protein
MAELDTLGQLLEIHTVVVVVVAHILLAVQLELAGQVEVERALITPMSMRLLAQLILVVAVAALGQLLQALLVLLEQVVLDL